MSKRAVGEYVHSKKGDCQFKCRQEWDQRNGESTEEQEKKRLVAESSKSSRPILGVISTRRSFSSPAPMRAVVGR